VIVTNLTHMPHASVYKAFLQNVTGHPLWSTGPLTDILSHFILGRGTKLTGPSPPLFCCQFWPYL